MFLLVLLMFSVIMFAQNKNINSDEEVLILKRTVNDLNYQVKSMQNKINTFINEQNKKSETETATVSSINKKVDHFTGAVSNNSEALNYLKNDIYNVKFQAIYDSIRKRSNVFFFITLILFVIVVLVFIILNNNIKKVNTALIANIDEAKLQFNQSLDDFSKQMQQQIQGLKENISNDFNQQKTQLTAKLQDFNNDLLNKINLNNKEINDIKDGFINHKSDFNAKNLELAGLISDLKNSFEKQIQGFKTDLNDTAQKLKSEFEQKLNSKNQI